MSNTAARVPTERITLERLTGCREVLHKNHATPVLLVAVGHDERAGQLSVVVTEDCSNLQLRAWLTAALRELED